MKPNIDKLNAMAKPRPEEAVRKADERKHVRHIAKQVLSIEQMQHLQELGLELKETILVWARFMLGKTQISDWEIAYNHSAITDNSQTIPAYTLQDVLDALPDFINEYCLIIDMSFGVIRYDNLTRKNNPILKEKYFNDEDNELIDAAYSLLCWCIENGYLDTNKNE